MELYQLTWFFFVYGVLGWCLEVAYAAVKHGYFVNRGFLNGPICPIYGFGVVAVVATLMPYKEHLIILYIASTVVVSVLEGMTGFVMDKIFHHRWWDYTGRPLNIGGYVCLEFSLIWGVFCVFIVKVFHPLVVLGVEWIPVIAGVCILVVFTIGAIADAYVTGAAIIKLNKKLEAMEKIAEELRLISDKMGEEIFENVMEAERKKRIMDKRADVHIAFAEQTKKELSEEVEQKLSGITDGIEHKMAVIESGVESTRLEIAEKKTQMEEKKKQLEEKYRELLSNRSRIGVRLVNAFPDMHFRDHNDQLGRLKLLVKAEKIKIGKE